MSTNTEPKRYDDTVLMPIPVTPTGDSRMMSATKFLSWLTAMLLAAAVLVSLVAVTDERNDLRRQIELQSQELSCRSNAQINVNSALVDKQNAIGDQNVILGEIIVAYINGESDLVVEFTDDLAVANEELRLAGEELDAALAAQQEAATECKIR
jgi:hypothetical protein